MRLTKPQAELLARIGRAGEFGVLGSRCDSRSAEALARRGLVIAVNVQIPGRHPRRWFLTDAGAALIYQEATVE